MRGLIAALLALHALWAQSTQPRIPAADAVRIREFYRLAAAIQDRVWPGWSAAPAPLLLVTPQTEFLTHAPRVPEDFQPAGDGYFSRPRQFSAELLATFPAFGPPSVIVIGEPEHTEAKRSTPWLFVALHEHFHQLQDGRPDVTAAVEKLGLARGDTTGMWMLNFPFPYDRPELGASFAHLRESLLGALRAAGEKELRERAGQYAAERARFMGQLSADDRKYLNFQLWKEGIARYVQIRAAEEATEYQPSPEFAALADFDSFAEIARETRRQTLEELQKANLATWKRRVVYSWGAAEGLLLDRVRPEWRRDYFRNLFTLDPYFEN